MVSQSLTKDSFRAVPHRQRFAAKPRPVPCGCYGSGLIYGDDDRAFYCDCKIGIERERQGAADDLPPSLPPGLPPGLPPSPWRSAT